MAFRRGRGQFSAGTTRSGKSFVHDTRRVLKRPGVTFQLQFNGQKVTEAIFAAIDSALNGLSDEALAYMQSIVPVRTGNLRDSCFVDVTNDGRIRIRIGADAYYAIYIELGTSKRAATPYIRPTYDYVVAKLPSILRKGVASGAR